MNFFTRARNGWDIARSSFNVLQANKQLIIFPLISGISLVLITGSFVAVILNSFSGSDKIIDAISYGYLFAYYLVNYFIIVFFNTALTHCISLYFKGEEVSIKRGMAFSVNHVGIIFSWALLLATVGIALRIIQDYVGFFGKIIAGFAGAMFSMATFFVVPVIASENLWPLAAFKRSTQLIRQKWGIAVGGAFNFIFIQFIAMVFILIFAITIGTFLNVFAGIGIAIGGAIMLLTVMSAARSIFVCAVYHNIKGEPIAHFEQEFVEKLFIIK